MREMTFEQYLRENLERGVIDFSLRASGGAATQFYIHPTNVAGETPDYLVIGNELTQVNLQAPAAGSLQLFKCHKEVRAMKIKRVEGGPESFVLAGELKDVVVDKAWIDKHAPRWGGYYVEYEDGYSSFSPAEAFEKGYEEVK